MLEIKIIIKKFYNKQSMQLITIIYTIKWYNSCSFDSIGLRNDEEKARPHIFLRVVVIP